MSCTGCSVGLNGKPPGCRSHGDCLTGSCNRLNSYDWLWGMPTSAEQEPFKWVEISFHNGMRKAFCENTQGLPLKPRELVVVEGEPVGYDIGVVLITGELARRQLMKKEMHAPPSKSKRILHKPTEEELNRWDSWRKKEKPTLIQARAIVRQMNLNMKISEVIFQADGRKATFYYTADERVDFRELIKVLAQEFHVRIEMHQIGLRQEAGLIGGIGSCGRELCCSTWLTQFKNVTTSAARYQNLSINQSKLSGQCGRLKCCLNYELDTYVEALKAYPTHVDRLETEAGIAYLQKTDIFKGLMYYAFANTQNFYALTPHQVLDIAALNQQGKRPAGLVSEAVNAGPASPKEDYEPIVGHLSFSMLQRSKKKKKRSKKK